MPSHPASNLVQKDEVDDDAWKMIRVHNLLACSVRKPTKQPRVPSQATQCSTTCLPHRLEACNMVALFEGSEGSSVDFMAWTVKEDTFRFRKWFRCKVY